MNSNIKIRLHNNVEASILPFQSESHHQSGFRIVTKDCQILAQFKFSNQRWRKLGKVHLYKTKRKLHPIDKSLLITIVILTLSQFISNDNNSKRNNSDLQLNNVTYD